MTPPFKCVAMGLRGATAKHGSPNLISIVALGFRVCLRRIAESTASLVSIASNGSAVWLNHNLRPMKLASQTTPTRKRRRLSPTKWHPTPFGRPQSTKNKAQNHTPRRQLLCPRGRLTHSTSPMKLGPKDHNERKTSTMGLGTMLGERATSIRHRSGFHSFCSPATIAAV